jgi:hypothetical protein
MVGTCAKNAKIRMHTTEAINDLSKTTVYFCLHFLFCVVCLFYLRLGVFVNCSKIHLQNTLTG